MKSFDGGTTGTSKIAFKYIKLEGGPEGEIRIEDVSSHSEVAEEMRLVRGYPITLYIRNMEIIGYRAGDGKLVEGVADIIKIDKARNIAGYLFMSFFIIGIPLLLKELFKKSETPKFLAMMKDGEATHRAWLNSSHASPVAAE